MAFYVVDASVIAVRFIIDTHTPHVRAMFNSENQFGAPEFSLAEVANVIWKTARFHNLAPEIAAQHIRDLRAIPILRAPIEDSLELALTIGLKHSLAIYDSIYIALAVRGGHPLLTLDERQQRAGQAEGLTVPPITDFNP